jgi:hypothetical protein
LMPNTSKCAEIMTAEAGLHLMDLTL